jgi:hypothetical protein
MNASRSRGKTAGMVMCGQYHLVPLHCPANDGVLLEAPPPPTLRCSLMSRWVTRRCKVAVNDYVGALGCGGSELQTGRLVPRQKVNISSDTPVSKLPMWKSGLRLYSRRAQSSRDKIWNRRPGWPFETCFKLPLNSRRGQKPPKLLSRVPE